MRQAITIVGETGDHSTLRSADVGKTICEQLLDISNSKREKRLSAVDLH
jgi:hypothetical protein